MHNENAGLVLKMVNNFEMVTAEQYSSTGPSSHAQGHVLQAGPAPPHPGRFSRQARRTQPLTGSTPGTALPPQDTIQARAAGGSTAQSAVRVDRSEKKVPTCPRAQGRDWREEHLQGPLPLSAESRGINGTSSGRGPRAARGTSFSPRTLPFGKGLCKVTS